MRKLGTLIDTLKQGGNLPGRHENPYLQEALHLNHFLYTQQDLENAEKNVLAQRAQIHSVVLEIGCYMGKTIVEMAQANPDKFFFGIDITYKRVVKTARKIKLLGLPNAKIAMCEGKTFLSNCVPDGALAGVCVFFPDPWIKDKAGKHRLLSSEFIELLRKKLSPNGFFWLKTDNEPYFKHSEALLKQFLFLKQTPHPEVFLRPEVLHGGPYETVFQSIFTAQNLSFFEGVYLNHDASVSSQS